MHWLTSRLIAFTQSNNCGWLGGCGCGCTSLDFKPPQQAGKVQRLADELAVYPDGQQAGLLLWGSEGEITSLEVYDFHPGSSNRFPEVSNLRTWEELGSRNLTRRKPQPTDLA